MDARILLSSFFLSIACFSHTDDPGVGILTHATETSVTARVFASEPPQSVEDRVSEIKKWYAEVQKLGIRNCKTYRTTKKDGLTPDNQFPFDQEVKVCRLNDRYELIQGKLLGYEWGETVNIYKRDAKVFFVFVEGGAEAFLYENRYYCDRDETVIRHLQKESEGGDDLSKAANKQVKLPVGRTAVYKYVSETFERVDEVMKAGK